MLSFNGVVLPTPTNINIDYADVTKARDTLSGRTIRRVLRRKKFISCHWDMLTETELSALLIVQTVDSGSLKYWDEQSQGFITTTVYVEDLNSSLQHARKTINDKLKTVTNVTLAFKEF